VKLAIEFYYKYLDDSGKELSIKYDEADGMDNCIVIHKINDMYLNLSELEWLMKYAHEILSMIQEEKFK